MTRALERMASLVLGNLFYRSIRFLAFVCIFKMLPIRHRLVQRRVCAVVRRLRRDGSKDFRDVARLIGERSDESSGPLMAGATWTSFGPAWTAEVVASQYGFSVKE